MTKITDIYKESESSIKSRRRFLTAAGVGSLGVFLASFIKLKKTAKYLKKDSKPLKAGIHPSAIKRKKKD